MSKFLKYCKTHAGLLKPHSKFVVMLGGGMAVKLYLKARGVSPIPKKVADTSDFDFTFATRHPLTPAEVKTYTTAMYKVMMGYLEKFVPPDKLQVSSYKAKGTGLIPATGKKAYHVIQFRLDGDDFVDCTLAYVPHVSYSHIDMEVSKPFGLPIQILNYMYKSVMVVLAGSFVYKGIMKRNPITGKNPEKGLKNAARVKALRKLKTSPRTPATSEFLKAIRNENSKLALRKAKAIIELIRIEQKKRVLSRAV